MSIIDDYLRDTDDARRPGLERVRRIIRTVAPEAEEAITYGMPGYKYKGKYLVSFAAFKDHSSIFPGSEAIEAYKKELGDFVTSKGTIQFTEVKPIPEALIKKIIKHRATQIDSKA